MPSTCVQCHSEFKAHHARQTCCSRQCAGRDRSVRSRVTCTCVFCHIKFEKKPSESKKYCSAQCDFRDRSRRMLGDRPIAKSTCVQCQREFHPRKVTAKFCSWACTRLARRSRVQVHCLHCDKQFEKVPSKTYGKFCSRPCAHAHGWKRTYPARNCAQCGVSYKGPAGQTPSKYCSQQCYGLSTRTQRDLNCAQCGKRVEKNLDRPSRKYCSVECFDAARKASVEYICAQCKTSFVSYNRPRKYCSVKCSDLGHKTRHLRGLPRVPYGNKQYVKLARQIRNRDNYQCQMCHKEFPRNREARNLHVDHIVPIRLGGEDIAENLWSLCAGCHARKDAKLRRTRRMFL